MSEDGATPHIKARELMKVEFEEAGVLFFDWPSKSPDLHPIEDIQNHHKKLLKKLRFETNSASKEAKQHARDEMKRIWQRDPQFHDVVRRAGSIANYMALALKARQHEGNNNFKRLVTEIPLLSVSIPHLPLFSPQYH